MKKVKCPYCDREFSKLSPSHIKTHGKTMEDLRRDYPELKPFFNSPFPPLKSLPQDDYTNYTKDRKIKRIKRTGRYE